MVSRLTKDVNVMYAIDCRPPPIWEKLNGMVQ